MAQLNTDNIEEIGYDEHLAYRVFPKNKEDWKIEIDNSIINLNIIIQIETIEDWGEKYEIKNDVKYDRLLTIYLLPIWEQIRQDFKEDIVLSMNDHNIDYLNYMDLDGYCGFGAMIKLFKYILSDEKEDHSFYAQQKYAPLFIRENEDVEKLIHRVILPEIHKIFENLDFYLAIQSRLCGTTNYDEIEKLFKVE